MCSTMIQNVRPHSAITTHEPDIIFGRKALQKKQGFFKLPYHLQDHQPQPIDVGQPLWELPVRNPQIRKTKPLVPFTATGGQNGYRPSKILLLIETTATYLSSVLYSIHYLVGLLNGMSLLQDSNAKSANSDSLKISSSTDINKIAMLSSALPSSQFLPLSIAPKTSRITGRDGGKRIRKVSAVVPD